MNSGGDSYEERSRAERSRDDRLLDSAHALMARDIFYEADADGRITFVSSAAERYGFDASALVGTELISMVAPEHRERVAGEFARTIMMGEEFPSEVPLVSPDGRVHWFEDCAIVVRENGRAVGITGYLRDISTRKTSATRLDHLRAVLDSHRTIGKLVLRTTSPQRLIQGVCDELVRTNSYDSVWIALVNGMGELRNMAHAGVTEDLDVLRSRIEQGAPPECWAEATSASGAIAIEDPKRICASCPIVNQHGSGGAMSVRLGYGGVTYGFLNVTIAQHFLASQDETSLLEDVAGDIAYALHNMDMASRKREAELALLESESRYHMLFEDSHDAVYVTSIDGRILEANPAMLALFGLTRDEMLGADAHTLYANPDDRVGFQHAIERSGTVADYELELKKHSGETMSCLLTTSVRRAADGSIVGYHGIIRDVTEQKQAEQALFESERLYRSIFKLSPEAIVLLDREGTFVTANDRLGDWLGYGSEEVIGRKILEMPFFTAGSKATVTEMFLRRMSGRPVAPYDLEFVAKDGSMRTGRIVGTVIQDEQGRPEADFVMISDVTEQRKAECALRSSRQKIEGLHGTARRLEVSEGEDEICRITANAAREVLEFPRCIVARASGGELAVQEACSDVSAGSGICTTVSTGPIAHAHRDGIRVVFQEKDAGGDLLGLSSGICVPLGDGVFCVGSDDPAEYGDEDVRLIELLLGHTGEALRRVRLLRELREQAIRDPLTGLYNRRHFSSELEKEIDRAKRYGHGIGFLMLDINGFKAINDSHGHHIGDDVLRVVARFLQDHVRASEMVVRYGGDEFLVVMPHSDPDIEPACRRLERNFNEWVDALGDLGFPLGVAVGGAVWNPDEAASIEVILALADERMYEDKHRQRLEPQSGLSNEAGPIDGESHLSSDNHSEDESDVSDWTGP
jgi:diguanylate cyclase (GGDEF)-like protein/PAS domain S-box-containing protein